MRSRENNCINLVQFGHNKIYVLNPTNYSLETERKKKGEVDSILTGLVKDLISITLNYQRNLQTLSLLLSFKLWFFSSVKMQEKQPLQNFDNFLGAHGLKELLYLRLLSELPSSVECWSVGWLFFFTWNINI